MASRVVLGLGGGLDYEIELSAATLTRLADAYRIRGAELGSPAAVTDERDLVVSILTYLRKGGGGEHFVASADVLRAFAERFPLRVTLGGTNVRAAIAMARLGVPSTLHLPAVDDCVRRLLPASCDYLSAEDRQPLGPHLIVQYEQGIRVRTGDLDIRAPFPNRLIYVNDPANETLPLSEELGGRLRTARVFLISGFNAIRDPSVLDARLAALRGHMRQLPHEAVVYYEDAGFHEPRFSDRVRAVLLPAIDVYGLNEDEMQGHLGRAVDLLSAVDVARALAEVRALIPVPTLVVHTKYWSAAYGERTADLARALDDGIVLASTRYSWGDGYTDEHVEIMRGRTRRTESTVFAADLQERLGAAVHCRPGLTLDVAEPTTIGLGDTFVGGFLAALAASDGRD